MVISHESIQGLVLGGEGIELSFLQSERTRPGACQPMIKQQPIARCCRHLPLLHCQILLNKRFNYTLARGALQDFHTIPRKCQQITGP